MEVIFTPTALSHLNEWKKSGNTGVHKKIQDLLRSIQENPFEGIGKPEPLKYDLAGKWSRRIDREHRVIYSVVGDKLYVYSLKGHY